MKLKHYLEEKVLEWQHILNSYYETDAGTTLEDHAQGRLIAYTEVLDFIKKQEVFENEKRIIEETRRTREQV
tara:strand:- start:429 stop:644 length:216 start_codon:yes stop_codon:yes gene_type:complete